MSVQEMLCGGLSVFLMLFASGNATADEPVEGPSYRATTAVGGETAGVPGTCSVYGADHCQLDNGAFLSFADRYLYSGLGRGVADDFVAQGTTISQICWWPAFFNADPETGFWQGECADPGLGADGPPRLTAVEVTFVDLPAPFDVLNGSTAWVGPPQARSENGSSENPIPGWPSYQNASLQCDPHYEHWNGVNTAHVTHEWIVPGGVYELRTVDPQCDPVSPSGPLTTHTGLWADTVGSFDLASGIWLATDGSVDVATDVVAALDKFGSAPGSPAKVRLDIDYAVTDGKINITDVTVVLDAFAGGSYPFAMTGTPCP